MMLRDDTALTFGGNMCGRFFGLRSGYIWLLAAMSSTSMNFDPGIRGPSSNLT